MKNKEIIIKKIFNIIIKLSFIVTFSPVIIIINFNKILNCVLNDGNLDSYFSSIKSNFANLENKTDKVLFVFNYVFIAYTIFSSIKFYLIVLMITFIVNCVVLNTKKMLINLFN